MIYINIAIFCHGTSINKTIWPRGDSNLLRRSRSTHYCALDHHASPKRTHKAQSKVTVSFSHSSNVISHHDTLFLLRNQYYCTVVYILIIYIAIFITIVHDGLDSRA